MKNKIKRERRNGEMKKRKRGGKGGKERKEGGE